VTPSKRRRHRAMLGRRIDEIRHWLEATERALDAWAETPTPRARMRAVTQASRVVRRVGALWHSVAWLDCEVDR